jgi:hypothetical protein
MHILDRRAQMALAGILAATLLVSAGAGAQQAATLKVAVRQLGPAMATSAEPLGSIAAVRQLPNGSLLVNDQQRRRLILLDSTLKQVGVVADSTSSTSNAYGARQGGLIAYRADSSLFVDPASLSMLVVDPAGKIARVMAAPRADDVLFLTGGPFGTPAFDARGRLVYRSFSRPMAMGSPASLASGVAITPPDTTPLVRYDLAARRLDTAGFFHIPPPNATVTRDSSGGIRVMMKINPLPLVDEWTVLSDGTIAVLRGREYRAEFWNADGTRTLGEKIPYEWQRLTDDDKVAFIDSTRAAMERARAAGPTSGGAPNGAPGGAVVAGGERVTFQIGGPPGAGGPPGGGERQIVFGGPGGPGGAAQPLTFVPPSELPDYKPVFGQNSVRADLDNRLWVRTIPTKPTPGGAIYDVIDRSGKLVDRVQVPAGATIAGFGPGGVVYLGMRDARGIRLLRARS